jgi:hypothetical protein
MEDTMPNTVPTAEAYRRLAEIACPLKIDALIAAEPDPLARAALVRNRAAIVRRYIEVTIAYHAGRLAAEREAAAARVGRRGGRVH